MQHGIGVVRHMLQNHSNKMINRIFILTISLLFCFRVTAQSIYNWIEQLNHMGMRHTQVFSNDTSMVIMTEAAQWRGPVNGIDIILQEVAAFTDKNRSVDIVMLDHGVPRVNIKVSEYNNRLFSEGLIDFSQLVSNVSLDITEPVKKIKSTTNYKKHYFGLTTLTLYPMILLDNYTFDVLYHYQFSLAPTLQTDLWRGGYVTLQYIVPIYGNKLEKDDEYHVRPGFITFTQEGRIGKYTTFQWSTGVFNQQRWGSDLKFDHYLTTINTTIGANIGYTGKCITYGKEKNLSSLKTVTGDIHINSYFPTIHSQTKLKITRFLSGSMGIRGDFTRHFGERSIGGYILLSDNQPNFGFYFAIPLNPKRYLSKGKFSIRLADYFDWCYSWLSFARYPNYGKFYETQPDENSSAHYWEPKFIKSSLQNMTDGIKHYY